MTFGHFGAFAGLDTLELDLESFIYPHEEKEKRDWDGTNTKVILTDVHDSPPPPLSWESVDYTSYTIEQ